MESFETLNKVKSMLLSMQRHAWEQGVAAQAFLESGEHEITVQLAREAVYRQAKDGRLAMVASQYQVTDPAANGEAVLFAAQKTGDEIFQQAADRMLNYLLHCAPRTADGVIHHINNHPQLWSDSAYMAPPFLAVAGYPEEAVQQIDGLRRYLWLPEKQLYAHIWDEGRGDFKRKACWGGGNGWVAAGITRILRGLPHTMNIERIRLISNVKEVIDGCFVHQRPDGMFYDVVDDPSTFPELTLGMMLAYSIYRGVQDGWLETPYLAKANLIRQVAFTKVDRYGLVHDVCGAPSFNSPGVSPEAQAFFILMEAAHRDFEQA